MMGYLCRLLLTATPQSRSVKSADIIMDYEDQSATLVRRPGVPALQQGPEHRQGDGQEERPHLCQGPVH